MRGAGLSLAAVLLLPGTGLGQVGARLDAGVGGPGLWSVAPELRAQSGAARIELTGEYRDFGRPGQGAAGTVAGSWFGRLGGPVLLEVTGTAQGQTGAGLTDAGAWWAGPRLHLARPDGGLSLGLQGGRDPHGPTRRWEAAAWKNIGRLSIQLRGWQTSMSLAESTGPDTLRPFPDTLADPTGKQLRTTTDFGVWLRWNGRRTDLAFASGVRFGLNHPGLAISSPIDLGATGQTAPTTSRSTWWLAEGTYWLMDRVGVVAAVGRQPADPAFETSGRGFFRLAFRATVDRRRPVPATRPATARPAESFRASRRADGLVEFTLAAPEAHRVEIMGDFTDWLPVSLVKGGHLWRISLPVLPGLHRLNVRYDGGPWGAPPVARVVRDEFGQESGELIVG
jgi:hypothetical protein